MRVLYYFPEKDTPMMQWQRIHFFDELSHHGVKIDVFNPLLYRSIDEAQDAIIKIACDNSYDMFMTCLCNEKHIYKATVETIKQKGIPTLSFRPDNLAIPYNDKKMSTVFDLIWLTSKDTQYLYDKWGANTIYQPYAANPYVYFYKGGASINKVCFIGNPHGSRTSIINSLSKGGIPVDMFYGGKKELDKGGKLIEPKWEMAVQSPIQTTIDRIRFREGRIMMRGAICEKIKGVQEVENNRCLNRYSGLTFEEMINSYSNYNLSLSFSSYARTDVLKHNLPVVNLRNFEIPMCGGVQLCRYSEEMASFFEDGQEAVLYHDNTEMIDKAKYYLQRAKEDEIRRMKEAARYRSENEHTWWCRFTKVFDALGLKY